MNTNITNIITELKTLTLLDVTKLIKEIEKTFGIDISNTPVSTGPISTETIISKTEKEEEQTLFEIILTEVPTDKRISVLKTVRNITGLGLKESKEIVDTVPKQIKQNVTKEEAEALKKDLENAGAVVVIK